MQRDHEQHTGVPTWIWAAACALIVGLFVLAFTPKLAFAADKGGPDVIPTIDTSSKPFSGPYLGAVLSRPMQSTEVMGLMSFETEDFCFGGNGGYDVRLANTAIVLGVKGSVAKCNLGSALTETELSWDILARAGLVIGQTTLIYGAAGYTATDGKFAVPTGFKFPDSGVTLGLGVETYATKNSTLGAELLWIDQGSTGGGMLANRMTVPRVFWNYRF